MTLSVKAKSDRPAAGSDGAAVPCLIGYARVSTDEQNLALQQDALRSAGCVRLFEDRGVSGAQRSRTGLDAALAMLGPGDVLVVWRLDRLGRSLGHLVQLIDRLSERGVGFRSLTESFDAASSGGRLQFHLMAAMAEFERALIGERTRAGLAAARSRGRRLGRPPRISAEQRTQAVALVRRGLSVREAAHEHGMHPRSLYRALAEQAAGRHDESRLP